MNAPLKELDLCYLLKLAIKMLLKSSCVLIIIGDTYLAEPVSSLDIDCSRDLEPVPLHTEAFPVVYKELVKLQQKRGT